MSCDVDESDVGEHWGARGELFDELRGGEAGCLRRVASARSVWGMSKLRQMSAGDVGTEGFGQAAAGVSEGEHEAQNCVATKLDVFGERGFSAVNVRAEMLATE